MSQEASVDRTLRLADPGVLDERFWEAAQTQVLGKMMRAMMHDLKAPLNAMVLNLELLRDRLATEASRGEDRTRHLRYAEVLKDEIARLNRLLLTLQAQVISAAEPQQRLDLRELIQQVEGFAIPHARQKSVRLETHCPEGVVWLTTHRDRFRLALLGVVSLLLERCASGGLTSIRLESSGQDIRIRMHVDGLKTPIPVGTDGRLLVEEFARTPGTGTGTELQAAAAVAATHGGSLEMGSGPEQPLWIQFNLLIPC